VNNKEFEWMSKSNRTLKSNDVQSILGHKGAIRLPLFIMKNNDEGLEFYFMGELSPNLNQIEQTTMPNDSGKLLPVVKFRFNLVDPVIPTMYNYLNEKVRHGDEKLKKTGQIIPIQESLAFQEELRNPIPLYEFYAAAGTFSEMQSEKDYKLIEGPENSSGKEYFACKIIGESMNRVIPNGSICLFKTYNGGSRNGKIVLVENMDIQDPDFNSAFTIKTYSSEKIANADSWAHTSIVLRPNSYDSKYKNIVIQEEQAQNMRVVGEFVRILKEDKSNISC